MADLHSLFALRQKQAQDDCMETGPRYNPCLLGIFCSTGEVDIWTSWRHSLPLVAALSTPWRGIPEGLRTIAPGMVSGRMKSNWQQYAEKKCECVVKVSFL